MPDRSRPGCRCWKGLVLVEMRREQTGQVRNAVVSQPVFKDLLIPGSVHLDLVSWSGPGLFAMTVWAASVRTQLSTRGEWEGPRELRECVCDRLGLNVLPMVLPDLPLVVPGCEAFPIRVGAPDAPPCFSQPGLSGGRSPCCRRLRARRGPRHQLPQYGQRGRLRSRRRE